MAKLFKNPGLQLPKIEAVIKELLRVYPIAPFISRHSYQSVNVGSVQLPPNVSIFFYKIDGIVTFPGSFANVLIESGLHHEVCIFQCLHLSDHVVFEITMFFLPFISVS